MERYVKIFKETSLHPATLVTEPDFDTDIFVTSNGFKIAVMLGGKNIGTFSREVDVKKFIKNYVRKHEIYPNVWLASGDEVERYDV